MLFINILFFDYPDPLLSRLFHVVPSSETQGRLAGARGNKSGKATKRRRFTSQAKKAPGNRLLPDHFQTALPMLPTDWAEKSFVLFCPIGEQQLLTDCNVFLHDDFRIALLARRDGRIIQRIFLPNQEAALVEPFGNDLVRVGSQGLFSPDL